jgi:hypothetical protein
MALSGMRCQARQACLTSRRKSHPKATIDVLLTTDGTQPQVGHFVDQSKGCYELRMCRKARFRALGELRKKFGRVSEIRLELGIPLPDGVDRHHC